MVVLGNRLGDVTGNCRSDDAVCKACDSSRPESIFWEGTGDKHKRPAYAIITISVWCPAREMLGGSFGNTSAAASLAKLYKNRGDQDAENDREDFRVDEIVVHGGDVIGSPLDVFLVLFIFGKGAGRDALVTRMGRSTLRLMTIVSSDAIVAIESISCSTFQAS